MLKEEEVCAFYDIELGHDHQPSGFVDQSINVLKVRGIFRQLSYHPELVDIYV